MHQWTHEQAYPVPVLILYQNSVSNLINLCPVMLGMLLLLAVKDMLACVPFNCSSLLMDLSFPINFMYSNHFITHSSWVDQTSKTNMMASSMLKPTTSISRIQQKTQHFLLTQTLDSHVSSTQQQYHLTQFFLSKFSFRIWENTKTLFQNHAQNFLNAVLQEQNALLTTQREHSCKLSMLPITLDSVHKHPLHLHQLSTQKQYIHQQQMQHKTLTHSKHLFLILKKVDLLSSWQNSEALR